MKSKKCQKKEKKEVFKRYEEKRDSEKKNDINVKKVSVAEFYSRNASR